MIARVRSMMRVNLDLNDLTMKFLIDFTLLKISFGTYIEAKKICQRSSKT